VELDGITLRGPEGRPVLDGVALALRRGEVLGIAGVEGNGQEALCRVLAGLDPAQAGRVRGPDGTWRRGRAAARRLRRLAGHVPADRQLDGVARELSVQDNLVLRAVRRPELRRGPLLRLDRLRALAAALVRRLDVRTPGLDVPAGDLSGGNQQKLVLARELDAAPGFLIAAHPARGLDVAATAAVWKELSALAAAGTPVLLVSADLDEVLLLSHRVAVLHRGRLRDVPPGATRGQIGAWMAGGMAETSDGDRE
jgi:simple sugar transport system ATP-binding protein